MFVPFTPNSELAKLLRENEEKLAKLTRMKIKIVERTGSKLLDLLTNSNLWQGQDCGRLNCLLFYTKSETGKLTTQECSKRSLAYQTRCLTCEEKSRQEIEEEDISDKEKTDQKKKIKLHKGSLHKKKPEIYWSFTNKGGRVPPDHYISVFFLQKTFIA